MKTKYDVYHALIGVNEHCLPGQEYILAGQVQAPDVNSAYLRSICVSPDRHTHKGDVLHDLNSNQCYLVMTRGLYPVNLNWIQPKTV